MTAAPTGPASASLTPDDVRLYYRHRVPKLKQVGARWRGPCPLHNGSDDNFSVSADTGGWVCFSQCSGKSNICKGDIYKLEMEMNGSSFPEAKAEVDQIIGRATAPSAPVGSSSGSVQTRREVAKYVYQDEKGKTLYEVVRYEPKTFRQRRPDGQGGWIGKLGEVRRVLYKLPDLLQAPVVWVVEGERDVESLRKHEQVATCNSGGAGKWREEFSALLAGKKVAVIPDADAPGGRHALDVAESLLKAGVEVLKIVELPRDKDVSEFFERGGTTHELLKLRHGAPALDAAGLEALRGRWLPGAAPRISDVSQVPSIWQIETKLDWLVNGLIARGSVTLLSGESGVGKTWFALDLAGKIAHGHPVLGRSVAPSHVLYVDGENPAYVIKDRLKLLGISETESLKIWGEWLDAPLPGPHEEVVQKFARETKGLIIYDPLIRFHPGSEQSSTETRAFMQHFRQLAHLGSPVIVLHHTGKADSAKLYRGSSDIKAAVDTAYKLNPFSEEQQGLGRFTLQCFKGRVAPGQNVAIEFREGEGFIECETQAGNNLRSTTEAVREFLRDEPGSNQSVITKQLSAQGYTRKQAHDALVRGPWRTEKGDRGAKLFYLPGGEGDNGEVELEI